MSGLRTNATASAIPSTPATAVATTLSIMTEAKIRPPLAPKSGLAAMSLRETVHCAP